MSHWSEHLPDDSKPVASWTDLECSAYVEAWDEGYSERYAEAGSGAVSLGWSPGDAGIIAGQEVERPESDPLYVEAKARLRLPKSDLEIELAHLNATPDDEIPF